jgi:hypothetical protein
MEAATKGHAWRNNVEKGGSALNIEARAEELPTLTPKQRAFVEALLEGKRASDAYREAYDCEAIASGQISAAVQAEHYRGKAAGLYEERLRLTSGPSDEELLKTIEDLLGKEVAETLVLP